MFRKINKRISAQTQIVLTYTLFMFIAMIVIAIFLSFMMYRKTVETTYEKMNIYVDKTKESLEQSFSLVANSANAVAASDTILRWIDYHNILDPEHKDYFSNLTSMESEIKHILSYSSAWRAGLIGYILIYVDDELISCTNPKYLPKNKIVSMSNDAYENIQQEVGEKLLPPFKSDDFLYYALKLKYDYASDKSLVIFIGTNQSSLQRQYISELPATNSQTFIVNKDGIIFSATKQNLIGTSCESEILDNINYSAVTELSYNGEKYAAIAKQIDGTDLVFINLVPNTYLRNEVKEQLMPLILIILVLVAILLVIGVLISRKITLFVKDLTDALICVKHQDYDAKMQHYENDAINNISITFNEMTSEMKHLINEIYQSKIMLHEMEFAFLEQQMNPHFLFNILLVIQIKAKMCSDETVYKMLTSLSGLLRASLHSDKNTYITLEEEFKYVNLYLYLQQQRFCDKLVYNIDVDDELKNTLIPRLTIEPIVENCVIHGVEKHNRIVHIDVKVKEHGDDIIVEIQDDGAGFDVDSLNLSVDNNDSQEKEKIGLRNINTRLKLLYGEDYGLDIKSELDKGTRVTMRIGRKS